jgi:uncharacterized protein (DUF1501 family)
MLPYLHLIPDAIEELWVNIVALKSEATLASWRALAPTAAVNARYVANADDWYGVPRDKEVPLKLLDVSSRIVTPI